MNTTATMFFRRRARAIPGAVVERKRQVGGQLVEYRHLIRFEETRLG
jgi:hypothetical protein